MIRIFHIGWILSLLLVIGSPAHAQNTERFHPKLIQKEERGGDTLYCVHLNEVNVYGGKRHNGKAYRNTRNYWRTVRNIRIVFPYAQMANQKVIEINDRLENIHSQKERRKIIRQEYRALMKEYKKPLMRLKISQGKLLMKLVDRETGNTSYEHLKELKGSVSAVFWQSIALVFGTSLKSEYDPAGRDWMVEEILQRMQNGELAPPPGVNLTTIRR